LLVHNVSTHLEENIQLLVVYKEKNVGDKAEILHCMNANVE